MKRKYPDGPKINLPLALLAQMLPRLFRLDPLTFSDGLRKFGDIAHYKFGPLHVYQLNDPSLIRQVLVEEAEKFHKATLVKRAFRPISREGLLTSDGALWKQQRKLMQPAFHHRQLAGYAGLMADAAQTMMDSFADGEIRDIGTSMTKLTLGIVVKSLFGADLPPEASEITRSLVPALDATNRRLNSVVPVPSWVPTPRHLRERRAIAKLDAMLQLLIKARRASTENRDDLLSILLAAVDEESGVRMSDQQLRDEMTILFLAGHDTTASALTWTWYLLSRHPEIELKLSNELDRVLQGRSPCVEDLPKLGYTEMVIREAMRLYPPAPGFAREPVEDVTIGGYEVPRGSVVLVHTWALHHDERFFPDPERFDPERFAPGWEERIPRYAYLPFGGGPRICIGNGFAMMEAKLVLATVSQRWRFALESNEAIRPIQLVTVRPGAPVRMRLERREPASRGSPC